MKNTPKGFKIITATLLAVIVITLLNRLFYHGFVMNKVGFMVKYDFEVWKQYWQWLPGKILCISNASLILLLIIESILMIYKGKK